MTTTIRGREKTKIQTSYACLFIPSKLLPLMDKTKTTTPGKYRFWAFLFPKNIFVTILRHTVSLFLSAYLLQNHGLYYILLYVVLYKLTAIVIYICVHLSQRGAKAVVWQCCSCTIYLWWLSSHAVLFLHLKIHLLCYSS